MKNTRYSSHIQLQYLMKKYGISQKQLVKELNQYYGSGKYELIRTKTNKVVGLKKVNRLPLPASVEPKLPQPKSPTKQVKVIYKRKRVIDKSSA